MRAINYWVLVIDCYISHVKESIDDTMERIEYFTINLETQLMIQQLTIIFDAKLDGANEQNNIQILIEQ